MKPITYYTSGSHLEKLCEQFGYELEQLDREQKLELRIILTCLVWGKGEFGDDYSIGDAWEDSNQKMLIEDPEIIECLEILEGISVKDTESLLIALQAQCTQGNARLKTPVETMTKDLVSHGVNYELALDAANIILRIDGTRERSKDEQGAIDSVHKILAGTTIKV